MSSAWMAGADVAPPAAPPASVVVPASGCSSCGAPAPAPAADCGGCCDSGCGKASLFDRLKAKFGGGKHRKGDCCDTCAAPAPTPCCAAPAPCAVPAPCDACAQDTCGGKAGFLDRLKGKFGGKHNKGGDCCNTCDTCGAAPSGCALPGAPGAVPPTAPKEAPKEMPKPATPKTTSISLPIPVAPVTPVSAPKLTGTTNPF